MTFTIFVWEKIKHNSYGCCISATLQHLQSNTLLLCGSSAVQADLLTLAAVPQFRPCVSLALDSYQCRSLASCHLPCSICVTMTHGSSLFSSLASSRSSLYLPESGIAHFHDAPIALCDSISVWRTLACDQHHVIIKVTCITSLVLTHTHTHAHTHSNSLMYFSPRYSLYQISYGKIKYAIVQPWADAASAGHLEEVY